MDLSAATFWWVAAGVAVAVELATGTFYLLMIALGLAGAAVAMFGLGVSAQIVAAALIGGGATALWHRRRFNQPQSAPARENRDVNLDIGERVNVRAWNNEGTAQVQYRGSTWTARLAPGATPASGEHLVSAVEGNWLVLTPRTPH
jgi:membrane protein implicated in regulation of membrane protease activity